METTSRTIEYVRLDDVAGTEGNPKAHDLPTVIRSISVLGFTAPAVIDERTDRLIIGNGRLEALRLIREFVTTGEPPAGAGDAFTDKRVLKALGADADSEGPRRAPDGIQVESDGDWCAPVVRGWASRDDDHARAAVVADNKLTERGGWDDQLLPAWLDDILDGDPDLLDITGFSRDDLDDMLAAIAPPPSLDDLADEYGEPQDSDLWPILRFQVPPHIRNTFYDLTADAGVTEDSARFIHLIETARADV